MVAGSARRLTKAWELEGGLDPLLPPRADTIDEGLATTGGRARDSPLATPWTPTCRRSTSSWLKSIIGNLLGTYSDLQQFMTLAARGKVRLAVTPDRYRLDQVNQAMAIYGCVHRSSRGVLIP